MPLKRDYSKTQIFILHLPALGKKFIHWTTNRLSDAKHKLKRDVPVRKNLKYKFTPADLDGLECILVEKYSDCTCVTEANARAYHWSG